METNNFIEYDGIRFYRSKSGYFVGNIGKRPNRFPKRLHIYVWEKQNGKVPAGYDIHHKDGDKNNNSIDNLELLQSKFHKSMHSSTEEAKDRARKNMEIARPYALEYKKTEEFSDWAKGNWSTSLGKLVGQTIKKKCEFCGREYDCPAIHPSGKYCSNACKSAARRLSGADNETRQCVVCGKEFQTNKYLPAMTCGKECRKIYQGTIVRERNGKGC